MKTNCTPKLPTTPLKKPAVINPPPGTKSGGPATPKPPQQDSRVTSTNKRVKKPEHSCAECNLTFVSLLTLKMHRAGHQKNDCSKCAAKFAKRRQLVNHLKQVHLISTAEKYYECSFCPRRFVKKPSLWFHYTVHVKVRGLCLCGVCLWVVFLQLKYV